MHLHEEGHKMKSIILNVAPKLAPASVISACTEIVDLFEMEGAHVVENTHNPSAPHNILAIHLHILSALHRCPSGTVFIMEHDVLYHPTHLDWEAKTGEMTYLSTGYYYFLEAKSFAFRSGNPLSTLAGDRDAMIKAFTERVGEHYRRGKIKKSEPEGGFRLGHPYIDIRHGMNYSGSRLGISAQKPFEWEGYDFNVLDSHTL